MNREEAINQLKDFIILHREQHGWDVKTIKALEMAIKALEQKPCEDAISRAEVLDLIDSKDPNYEVRHFKEDVECLLPVTPQPKIGKWIKSRDSYGNNHFTCPFCEHDIATKYAGTWEDNYCSNCGAFLGGDNNGNE